MALPRLAVRAVVVHDGRLLLVNGFADRPTALWVAPGGGVEAGCSLGENLVREVQEETGLSVRPGALLHVSEFHAPETGFHQVELYFAAELVADDTAKHTARAWRDPAGVVTARRWACPDDLAQLPHKPDRLAALAFGPTVGLIPGALERMVR